jgi:hypothetical protein
MASAVKLRADYSAADGGGSDRWDGPSDAARLGASFQRARAGRSSGRLVEGLTTHHNFLRSGSLV